MQTLALYLKRSFQKNGKSFIYIVFAITLTIMLMTIVTVFVDSASISDRIHTMKNFGTHHVFMPDRNGEQTAFVKNHRAVDYIQEVKCLLTNHIVSKIQLKAVSEKDTIHRWMFELRDGAMPEKGEVLIPDSLKQVNGANYIIGDNIEISFVSGEKTYKGSYRVAGIFSEKLFYRNYIIMNDESFSELLKQFQDVEIFEDLYIYIKENVDYRDLTFDYFYKYNQSDIIINGPAISMTYITPEFVFIYIVLISLAMLVGGVCLFTVISMYLKDSGREYLILRLLGAGNRQIRNIILIQLLVILLASLPPGFCAGVFLFKLIAKQFENLDSLVEFHMSAFTYISIPLVSVAVLIISSIRPIHKLLSLPPVLSLQEQGNKLSRYISYENKAEKYYKKPFLWYAGVQALRLKGRAVFLCLVTTVCMGLFIISNVVFGFQATIAEKFLEDAHFTMEIDVDDSIMLQAMETGEKIGFRYDDYKRLSDIAGIRYININQITGGFIQLDEERKDIVKDGRPLNDGEYYFAEARVMPFDSFEKKHLQKYLVAGSLDSINEDDMAVIVQDDNWSKSRKSSYQIGDKLLLQDMVSDSTSARSAEFTVRAIVKGVPRENDSKINLYLSCSAFDDLYGISAYSIGIYSDTEKIGEVREALNKTSREDGYIVRDNSERVEKNFKLARAMRFFGLILSLNILFICTVLLLCYYTYYFRTRDREFVCLGAIGCSERMLGRIIINESMIYSLISAAVSLITSYIVSYYIYTRVSVYPNDFDWKIPWLQMGVSLFIIVMVNVVCVYNSVRRIGSLRLVIPTGEQ